MKTFDTASFSLNAEQQAMLDELYPIINEEFKYDGKVLGMFAHAVDSPNPKLAFVSAINPLVIKMAHDLGSTLNIPLAAIISRTIANEWLEEVKTFNPQSLESVKEGITTKVAEVLALPAEVVIQDEYLTGIENRVPSIFGWGAVDAATDVAKERIVGTNPVMAAPYGAENVAVQDEPIIPTSVPRKSLARGSAGQDRSKPVLTVAVLRGLHDLLKIDLHQESVRRGRPDARLAVKYLQRLAAWGDKREASKEK